jgi:LPS sulfotransferase NodH
MTQKIFILAEPRSGSTWLLKTLNSHKNINLSGELFNHAAFKEVLRFHGIGKENFYTCIDYLENKLTGERDKYSGCKILLPQLLMISDEFPGWFIKNYKDSSFIFLYRENTVLSLISLTIAHTYKTWHITKTEDIKKRTVHINIERFYSQLERTRHVRSKFLELFSALGVKSLTLTYEALTQKERIVEKICEFLQISDKRFTFSSEKKGNPFPPKDIIENYEEVKNYLKRYPHYYQMLLQHQK